MSRTRKLRSLNLPRPISAESSEDGRPLALTISNQKLAVTSCRETWRIDDEWWRANPISRLYWRVTLDDGRVIDVYHDLAVDGWFRQAYE